MLTIYGMNEHDVDLFLTSLCELGKNVTMQLVSALRLVGASDIKDERKQLTSLSSCNLNLSKDSDGYRGATHIIGVKPGHSMEVPLAQALTSSP